MKYWEALKAIEEGKTVKSIDREYAKLNEQNDRTSYAYCLAGEWYPCHYVSMLRAMEGEEVDGEWEIVCMERRLANRKIVEKLRSYLEKNPDTRFGQALLNLRIVETKKIGDEVCFANIYNEEPWETLEKMKEKS